MESSIKQIAITAFINNFLNDITSRTVFSFNEFCITKCRTGRLLQITYRQYQFNKREMKLNAQEDPEDQLSNWRTKD